MNNILQEIIANKQREIEELRPLPKKSFKASLLNNNLSVIAEIKRKSPAKGELAEVNDPVLQALIYKEGGANAISVLTDKRYFGGSLADLATVSKALRDTKITVLRKDFIIDPIQIAEAVLAGADAVLLIVAVLKDKLKIFLDYARTMHIEVLVEVHNLTELKISLDAGSEIIGINNRNLETLQIDINNSFKLINYIPKGIVKVSESGIMSSDTAKELSKIGFDAVLVGEMLMSSKHPDKLIHEMRDKSTGSRFIGRQEVDNFS